tara:strand:+ start:13941 stop:15140 length:1200 start_codon:yes stop_codon:yes gene_type:complete
MSIVNNIYQGSYKGHPIKIESATTTGGRKVSVKQYPNRDDQTVEDLGLNPRKYSVDIIVSGATTDDYFPEKDALLRVLELVNPGELVHPFYGRLTNMVAVSWTMLEESTSMGYGKLAVQFEVSSGTGIPESAGVTVSQIQADLQSTLAVQTASFQEDYSLTTSFISNVTDALDKANDYADTVTDAVAFVGQTTDELTNLATQITSFKTGLSSIIAAPDKLITAINNVFNTVDNLFDSPNDTLKAYQNMFGYGDSDITLDLDNPINNERTANRSAMNSVVNLSALAGAYLAASQIQSTTVQEIDAISESLDAQYESVYSSAQTPVEVKTSLAVARVTVREFLNTQRLTAAEIVQTYVNITPARLISFNYYNDSTRGLEISKLNEQYDMSFIEGNIDILSE